LNKYLLLFLLSSLLLFGCSAGGEKTDGVNWDAGFKETQKIEVMSSVDSEILATITDDKKIKDFIESLQLDRWELEKIPSEVVEDKKYKMYQSETVKFGESDDGNNELNEVAEMTTYKDISYIKLNIKNTNFSFKVPEEVAEYLSNLN